MCSLSSGFVNFSGVGYFYFGFSSLRPHGLAGAIGVEITFKESRECGMVEWNIFSAICFQFVNIYAFFIQFEILSVKLTFYFLYFKCRD